MTDKIPDEIVEVATMTLLGHEKRGDLSPGVDWSVQRDWTINIVRRQMRKALAAVSDHQRYENERLRAALKEAVIDSDDNGRQMVCHWVYDAKRLLLRTTDTGENG